MLLHANAKLGLAGRLALVRADATSASSAAWRSSSARRGRCSGREAGLGHDPERLRRDRERRVHGGG